MGGGCAVPRFFIEEELPDGAQTATLSGEDAAHLSYALRARVGEEHTLCDTGGNEYRVSITGITAKEVRFAVHEKKRSEAEPTVHITLYQALVKGEKFDDIVQKAVELGASVIVPVACERSVVRLDEKNKAKKTERWQKIARGAAMQSERGLVPQVREPIPFEKALRELSQTEMAFVCYEREKNTKLSDILDKGKQAREIGFLVGPEGGFGDAELRKAAEAGLASVSLGKRILRTETAPLCVLSAILYQTGDLG